jgi:prepilin-type N-terminal cleavage/methylation domain-containing protein
MKFPAFTLLELLVAVAITASLAVIATSTLATVAQTYSSTHEVHSVFTGLQVVSNGFQNDLQSSTIAPVIVQNSDTTESGEHSSIVIVEENQTDVSGISTGLQEYRVYCIESVPNSSQQDIVRFTLAQSAIVNAVTPAFAACTSSGISALFSNSGIISRQSLTEAVIQVSSFIVLPIRSSYESTMSGVRFELAGRYRVQGEFSGAEDRASKAQTGVSQVVFRGLAVRNNRYSGSL